MDSGGAGALFLEIVRERHRGQEHVLRRHRPSCRNDEGELGVDDRGEPLQLVIAGAGHDAVRLTSDAERYGSTGHPPQSYHESPKLAFRADLAAVACAPMPRPWRSDRRTRWTGALLGVALLGLTGPARAEPQASVGLTLGAAGEGYDRHLWQRTAFHLGLHGDVLFGRSNTSDFGIGPYAEIFTHAFDEVQVGGGISGLLPVLDPFPIVLSVGAYARKGSDKFQVEPGLAGELFWGTRSYNFHSRYVLSGGLLAQMRYGLGPSRETSIVLAAQVDLGVLVLPVLFLITAARGGSTEAAPVR